MKIRALVVAPYAGLAQQISQLAYELAEFEITTILGDLSEGLHLFEERDLNKEFDVVISRGGTAALLRQHISMPVVDIQVSGYDILRMVTLLAGYQSRMKILGFPNVIQGFQAVSNLLNVDISYAEIYQESEVEVAVKQAKEEGALVIIGDNITTRVAKENGLQGVLVTSGREAVMDAFRMAKHICQELSMARIRNMGYEAFLNDLEEGAAVVSHTGEIAYANPSFRACLQLQEPAYRTESAILSPPFLQRLLRNAAEPTQTVVYETERRYAISTTRIVSLFGVMYYSLKLTAFDYSDEELQVTYHKKSKHRSYPQIIMGGEQFKTAGQRISKSFEQRLPAAVYGETGTGKMLLMHTLYQAEEYADGGLVEVVIRQDSGDTLAGLTHLLLRATADELIYIRGLENMSIASQQKLQPLIQAAQGRIVFSFTIHPKQFKKMQQLDGKLYELFMLDGVYFPPIRENMKYMEDLVRTFIVQFNEKYGKQVVGARPSVLAALRAHPWMGNLIEVKDVIEQLVRNAKGEYIEDDAIEVLQSAAKAEVDANDKDTKLICLNQPLEDIERDIIQAVMEMENMNQSRVAKRLQINRSTLWRKLQGK